MSVLHSVPVPLVRVRMDLQLLLSLSADPETQKMEPEMKRKAGRRNTPDCVLAAKAPYLEAIVQSHQIHESVLSAGLVVARGNMAWVMHAGIVSQCGDLRVDTETCNYRQHAASSAENMEVITPGEQQWLCWKSSLLGNNPEGDEKIDHIDTVEVQILHYCTELDSFIVWLKWRQLNYAVL